MQSQSVHILLNCHAIMCIFLQWYAFICILLHFVAFILLFSIPSHFLMRLLHLYKRVCPSVVWPVHQSVGLSVGPLFHSVFVKLAKFIGKSLFSFAFLCMLVRNAFEILKSIWESLFFCMFMRVHCMSNHSLVHLPIIQSVGPLFCPSVCLSVYPFICNHIVKIQNP